jgi:hypothetical protein
MKRRGDKAGCPAHEFISRARKQIEKPVLVGRIYSEDIYQADHTVRFFLLLPALPTMNSGVSDRTVSSTSRRIGRREVVAECAPQRSGQTESAETRRSLRQPSNEAALRWAERLRKGTRSFTEVEALEKRSRKEEGLREKERERLQALLRRARE